MNPSALRSLVLAGLVPLALCAQETPQAFIGARILPMEGPEIPHGVLVIHRGRITALGGPGTPIPEGAERHDARGKVLMPGLVDTHSHIGGAAGADGTAPLQPDVRVADALNARASSIQRARTGGVTTVNVMPGSGHLLSGQTAYLKLREGQTLAALQILGGDGKPLGGMKMANGTNPRRSNGPLPRHAGEKRCPGAGAVREGPGVPEEA